jgi:hypothetical protein
MSELCVPLDYEQLPELWRLRKALAARSAGAPNSQPSPKSIEAAANFLFARLFVTLGYLAKSTNQPGVLTETGGQQLRASLEPLFGDDCEPVALLAECGLLQKSEIGKSEGGKEYICPLFAKLNLHLSGDYKPGHIKGNVNSRLSVAMKNIVGESAQQMRLLPEGVFQKNDGTPMTDMERQSAVVIIRTLDRCLMRPSRGKFEFSAGLMATAHDIATRHDREKLKSFYFWLANNCERPEIARVPDEILRDFDHYFALAQAGAPAL